MPDVRKLMLGNYVPGKLEKVSLDGGFVNITHDIDTWLVVAPIFEEFDMVDQFRPSNPPTASQREISTSSKVTR